VFDRFLDRARAAVENDYLVSAKRQAVNHVAAHAAEPDEAKLHITASQSSFSAT
jgi:hypothetical protein